MWRCAPWRDTVPVRDTISKRSSRLTVSLPSDLPALARRRVTCRGDGIHGGYVGGQSARRRGDGGRDGCGEVARRQKPRAIPRVLSPRTVSAMPDAHLRQRAHARHDASRLELRAFGVCQQRLLQVLPGRQPERVDLHARASETAAGAAPRSQGSRPVVVINELRARRYRGP